MASSLLSLRLHPPLSSGPQSSPLNSCSTPLKVRANPSPVFSPKFPISASQSSNSPSSWEREETRWLREEQRWMREEQRWIREESRWNSERESLLRKIASLELRIEGLDRERAPDSDAVTNLEVALRAVKDRLAESGVRAPPLLVEEADVKEMVLQEIRVSDGIREKTADETKKKKRRTLRKGSEGEDVRTMQEALQGLGFYSGEEDMEYSSFSSGTERAVKTWQASLDTAEDGVMTSDLLERLFMEPGTGDAGLKVISDQSINFVSMAQRANSNGAAVASTGITEIKQSFVEDSGIAEIEVSEHRVFLIGENRWEEPSRLVGRDKAAVSATKCLSCRGEGRIMCTECDGTGEPNIEPQFLEWVGEETKCPYCEGQGHTICDVCGEKTIQQAQL